MGSYRYTLDSGSKFAKEAAAAAIELTGEDEDGLRKKGALKWDPIKKDFKRQTIGADNKKRIRTESGALIPASYKSNR